MADLSHTGFTGSGRAKKLTDAERAAAREAVNQRLKSISKAKLMAAPPELSDNQERRRAERKSVLKLARVYVNKIDYRRCVILNLSADGARIAFEEECELPTHIVLKFEQSGVKKLARIAWQHKNEFGLSFQKAEEEDLKDDDDYGY